MPVTVTPPLTNAYPRSAITRLPANLARPP